MKFGTPLTANRGTLSVLPAGGRSISYGPKTANRFCCCRNLHPERSASEKEYLSAPSACPRIRQIRSAHMAHILFYTDQAGLSIPRRRISGCRDRKQKKRTAQSPPLFGFPIPRRAGNAAGISFLHGCKLALRHAAERARPIVRQVGKGNALRLLVVHILANLTNVLHP